MAIRTAEFELTILGIVDLFTQRPCVGHGAVDGDIDGLTTADRCDQRRHVAHGLAVIPIGFGHAHTLGLAFDDLHLDSLHRTMFRIPLGIGGPNTCKAFGIFMASGAAIAFGAHDGFEGSQPLLGIEHGRVVEIICLHRAGFIRAEHPARINRADAILQKLGRRCLGDHGDIAINHEAVTRPDIGKADTGHPDGKPCRRDATKKRFSSHGRQSSLATARSGLVAAVRRLRSLPFRCRPNRHHHTK